MFQLVFAKDRFTRHKHKNITYINGLNEVHFNVRVPRDGNYVIETSIFNQQLDTYLILKDDQGNILTADDDGGDRLFSKITWNFQK